jgi:DNA-binding transcriptional regulator YiaG
MKLHRMLGVGLPNVYLDGGVTSEGSGEEETIAYADLDGLFFAMTRAISLSSAQMSKEELRFIRKRLKLTQDQVGAIGGKSGQVAAKWEKGELPVPIAEANLLRLKWLATNSRRDLSSLIDQLFNMVEHVQPPTYVFKFDGLRWEQDKYQASTSAASEAWKMTRATIDKVSTGAAILSQYTGGSGPTTSSQRTIRTDA